MGLAAPHLPSAFYKVFPNLGLGRFNTDVCDQVLNLNPLVYSLPHLFLETAPWSVTDSGVLRRLC